MGVPNVKPALRVDWLGFWLGFWLNFWRRGRLYLNHSVLHLGRRNGFHGYRFNHQSALKWRESKALLIRYFKHLRKYVDGRLEVKRQRGVTPLAPQLHTMHHGNLRRILALSLKITASDRGKSLRSRQRDQQSVGIEHSFDRFFAHCSLTGQAHAVCGKDAGQRMSEYSGHSERIRNGTCKLPSGTAKHRQAIPCDVVAPLDRDLFDCIRHVRHGNVDEPLCNLFGRMGSAGRITDILCEFFETGNDGVAIKRQVCVGPKNRRKVLGQHAPQENVGIGQGKWARTAIAGWAGIGTRRIRADAKPCAIEMQNRPATCGDRMNSQHGGA